MMGTRIENPAIKGACFIAENILKKLDKDAARRCGSYDTLYAIFFEENIYAFVDTLAPNERERFLVVAYKTHPFLEENTLTYHDAMREINQDQG